jgi:hypothetical protein
MMDVDHRSTTTMASLLVLHMPAVGRHHRHHHITSLLKLYHNHPGCLCSMWNSAGVAGGGGAHDTLLVTTFQFQL